MAYEPPDRRSSPYRSPDAVIAEARRMAADIRRRAERDAIDLRREAAEWASATRRDADRYRERILDVTVPELRGEVIDLRSAAEARGTPMVPADSHDEPADEPAGPDPDEIDHEIHHRQAVGGTYVVGQSPPPVETSIETKVHDVVRLAVRRTFHGQYR